MAPDGQRGKGRDALQESQLQRRTLDSSASTIQIPERRNCAVHSTALQKRKTGEATLEVTSELA